MIRYIFLLLGCCSILTCSSCKSISRLSSYDSGNVFVFTTGDSTRGVKECNEATYDMTRDFLSILSGTDPYTIESVRCNDTNYSLSTAQSITDSLQKAAKQVPDGGVLYWTHDGHGGEDGLCTIEEDNPDARLTAAKAMDAIIEARGENNPIPLIVAFIHACHSGNQFNNLGNYEGKAFGQAFFFIASTDLTIGQQFGQLPIT